MNKTLTCRFPQNKMSHFSQDRKKLEEVEEKIEKLKEKESYLIDHL